MKQIICFLVLLLHFSNMKGQVEQIDSISQSYILKGVSVKASNGTKAKFKTENTELITSAQLKRAACCNLGESFSTNPSVDVSYSDAATGARQIKLLGLSGTYVQMLTENVPNLRGGSIPFALSFVPGPWMQSIQVSKGASSVKNGYESITGQINIEYKKPQAEDGLRLNGYLDSHLKYELNADVNKHLTDKLSTNLLVHYEDFQKEHDGNHDGFIDKPIQRQLNLMHRWAYVSPHLISQLSVKFLTDKRESGFAKKHQMLNTLVSPYYINVDTRRYEMQWKNGYMFQDDNNTSIALMTHASWHDADNHIGTNIYDFTQKNVYAQLMYERDYNESHNIAVGGSFNYDYFCDYTNLPISTFTNEATPGVYTQYTYKPDNKTTLMAGVRYDHSNIYGCFITPRVHLKFSPLPIITMRASVGKGYRSPHALAENTPLLASGRSFFSVDKLKQEEAWNYGVSGSANITIAGKVLELNAEYYYTYFLNQMVINVDGKNKDHTVFFENLNGKSYSHTFQIDATYPFFSGFSATAAFRYNEAKTTYDGILRQRPLTSRFKGLFSLSYNTPLELWHFDLTGHLNGGGKLYDQTSYPTFFQLQGQITRDFRHFSIYAGAENITNYKIQMPIVNPHNPWESSFDATQVWGPTMGTMAYVGLRVNF